MARRTSDTQYSGMPLLAPDDAHWTERVVCEGHATYCKNHGHATETVGDCCARCGEPVSRETSASDTLPTCDTCGQCGTVPHSDGIVAEFDKYFPACDTCGQWREACACIFDAVATCPVCGQPIDYCQGHGDMGDTRGADIANSHDDNDHSHCHWRADCSPRNYWGTLKADISDDFCQLCERENPSHYSICPNNN